MSRQAHYTHRAKLLPAAPRQVLDPADRLFAYARPQVDEELDGWTSCSRHVVSTLRSMQMRRAPRLVQQASSSCDRFGRPNVRALSSPTALPAPPGSRAYTTTAHREPGSTRLIRRATAMRGASNACISCFVPVARLRHGQSGLNHPRRKPVVNPLALVQ